MLKQKSISCSQDLPMFVELNLFRFTIDNESNVMNKWAKNLQS